MPVAHRGKRRRPQLQWELRVASRQLVIGHALVNKGDNAAVTVKDERDSPVTYVGEVCKKRCIDDYVSNGDDVASEKMRLPLGARHSIFGVTRIRYFDTDGRASFSASAMVTALSGS